jgi:two-component system chemotaxis response regulator CheB
MSIAQLAAPAALPAGAPPIRVMVVDDAAVVRGLITRWVDLEPGLKVVASLRSGREAVDILERADPDVVVLDVEMPDLDGITALPLLLRKKRDLVVIMASARTLRNAEVSLRALALGALDYVPKPDGRTANTNEFRRELIEKIRVLGGRRRQSALGARMAGLAAHSSRRARSWAAENSVAPAPEAEAAPPPFKLRPFSRIAPRILLIGASTGGPQALTRVLSELTSVSDQVPVLIAQHMPAKFTTILADHLSRASGRPAREAEDGEPVLAGNIYVAPGSRHMRVARRNGTAVIALDDGPLINFCKPAVDPLFSSAAQVWGAWVLGVILTGMGADGTLGGGDIAAAGGNIIAQDEATSVVWGMPGSAAQAGICAAVLPLDHIAPAVVRLFARSQP